MLDQLEEVLDVGLADVVLIDNFDLAAMRKAVAMVAGRLVIEASGGITLDSAAAIAETGVDYSVLRLAHPLGAESRHRSRYRDVTKAATVARAPDRTAPPTADIVQTVFWSGWSSPDDGATCRWRKRFAKLRLRSRK